MAVTLSNEHDDVLGHAAFFDYPNLPQVDSAKWEEWLNCHYDATHCKSLNTLFMHYFVAKPEYSHGCAREIIRTMFNAVPELHSCLLVVPVGVFPGTVLYISNATHSFFKSFISFTLLRLLKYAFHCTANDIIRAILKTNLSVA